MSYKVLFDPDRQFLDNDSKILAGGKIYVYDYQTTTLTALYSDEGTTALANPVTLDSNGRATVYVDTTATMRMEVYDSLGNLRWVNSPMTAVGVDNIRPSIVATDGGDIKVTKTEGETADTYTLDYSGITSKIETVQTNLDKEAEERDLHDDLLRGMVGEVSDRITAEASTRAEADTTLQANIDAKLSDAPSDGNIYARKDGEWKVTETVVTESEYAAMEAAGTVDPEMKYVIVEDGE